MATHKIHIDINGVIYDTLEDVLPNNYQLKVLIIGKVPAPCSVQKGHYFQGKQGKIFWGKLEEYRILNLSFDEFEDDQLIEQGFGITDVVKQPLEYGTEPSVSEYIEGTKRILDIINIYKPKVVLFVYKKVLDNILQHYFRVKGKSVYGFNEEFDTVFNSKVFVFPMPGTPCKSENAIRYLTELSDYHKLL